MAGASVGIVSFMLFFYLKALSTSVLTYAEHFEQRYTGPFYAMAFFISFQLATMFNDIREPLEGLLHGLHLH
jgi:hypothetical protein